MSHRTRTGGGGSLTEVLALLSTVVAAAASSLLLLRARDSDTEEDGWNGQEDVPSTDGDDGPPSVSEGGAAP